MNNSKESLKTKTMVTAALLAAMIFLSTGYILHIPVGASGYVHIGDAFIYLAAVLLPAPYAMLAGAIGAGLADVTTGAAIWAIPTMMIKPMLVPFFTKKGDKIINTRNITATVLAGIVGTVLYKIAEGIITGNWVAALIVTPMTLVQPVGSAIVFILVGMAFDKAQIREKYMPVKMVEK